MFDAFVLNVKHGFHLSAEKLMYKGGLKVYFNEKCLYLWSDHSLENSFVS